MIFSEHIYLDCSRSKIRGWIKKPFVLSFSELDIACINICYLYRSNMVDVLVLITCIHLHLFSYASGGCPGGAARMIQFVRQTYLRDLDRLEFLKKEIKKWSESNGGLDLHVYQIRYNSFNFVKMKSKFCKIMTFKKKTHLQ